MRALFNEKEKELAVAVSKVDQLMTQLRDLQNVKTSGLTNGTSPKGEPKDMTLELEKLRNELLVRNDLSFIFKECC